LRSSIATSQERMRALFKSEFEQLSEMSSPYVGLNR
jgi:hypothetical protein